MQVVDIFLGVLFVEIVCFILFIAYLLPVKLGAGFITFVIASTTAAYFIL